MAQFRDPDGNKLVIHKTKTDNEAANTRNPKEDRMRKIRKAAKRLPLLFRWIRTSRLFRFVFLLS